MSFDPIRREVIRTCLELADNGFLAGTGGNVACRIDDAHFAITPSASDYYSLTPDDISVLRLADLVQVAGGRRPSVEHKLHAHVFRARPDCRASIHTHQPVASAYTLLGRHLDIHPPALQAMLGAKAIYVNYAPSGTGWLASRLRKSLRQDANAYLLGNHGVVCCGPSLPETIARVEALEDAAAEFFLNAITRRHASGAQAWAQQALALLAANRQLEKQA
jgi:L-fuculose-phosphate aldolase